MLLLLLLLLLSRAGFLPCDVTSLPLLHALDKNWLYIFICADDDTRHIAARITPVARFEREPVLLA